MIKVKYFTKCLYSVAYIILCWNNLVISQNHKSAIFSSGQITGQQLTHIGNTIHSLSVRNMITMDSIITTNKASTSNQQNSTAYPQQKTDFSPWPTFQKDQYNTGQSEYIGPQTNNIKWRFEVNSWMSSAVIAANGVIYFGTDNSRFYAFMPAGNKKWTFKLPHTDPPPDLSSRKIDEWYDLKLGAGLSTFAPAIANDGTIYFGSTFWPHQIPNNGRETLGLYAVNPDGSMRWFFNTNDNIISSPNISTDGTIYFISNDSLYAVDSQGVLKWRYFLDSDGIVVWCSPALDKNGIVYAIGKSLMAINPNGNLKWSYDQINLTEVDDFAATHPTIDNDGTIYFGFPNMFYAIYSNGSRKWVIDLGWTESSPVIDNDGTLYIGTAGTSIPLMGALNAINSTDGTIIWSFPVQYGIDSSPALGGDGTIYFGADDGHFYALNSNGYLKWSLDIGTNPRGEIDTAPAIDKDGTLYFGHAGGDEEHKYFYAIGNNKPGNFNLLVPPNGIEINQPKPTLVWQKAIDVDTDDSVRYIVLLSIQSDFSDTLLYAEVNDTLYTITNELEVSIQYYWKVIAVDIFGAGTESDESFIFTIVDEDTIKVSVKMTSLSAQILSNSVKLFWTTSTESNYFGFEIEKSTEGINFSTIGFVSANNTLSAPQKYVFKVNNIVSGTNYYRLKQIRNDGSFCYSEILEIKIDIPISYILEQNHPNPFNAQTIIRFTLPSTSHISITIYDITGKSVKTLIRSKKKAGYYSIVWDCKNEKGRDVSSGTYLYRFENNEFSDTKRMLLLR